MRVKITISYDGSEFFGSQSQKHTSKTVLGTLQNVLLHLGIENPLIASGRTDTGVHATAQVCHLDLPPFWKDLNKLHTTLHRMLPLSITVKKITPVSDKFHARYSAVARSYRYILTTSRPSPFEAKYVTFIERIDFEKLQTNLQLFLGEHDFVNFQKTGSDVKSSVREIYHSFAYMYKNYTILHFKANGFLRSQVRLMCAAALKLEAPQIEAMLKNKECFKLKPAAPNGLYLTKIDYKDHYG